MLGLVTRTVGVALALSCGLSVSLAAQERPTKAPTDLRLIRFEFDNDSPAGSDDGFTAGWSLQLHSRLMDRWNPANEKWLGTLPTLGDDGEGGRIVRWALGISQIIITPRDITIAEPQPNDSPWAGMLGLTGTGSSYDNRRLAAIQLYLGCLGPCSQAEHVQKFVHRDLGLADTPRGWKNQLSNKALVNLNYEYRRKLLAPEAAAYAPGRFATDLSLGGSGAAGNLTTRLTGEVELRFGWGLPMGFTKIPDPPGIGMALDPIYLDARDPSGGWDRWRLFFTVVARAHEITYLAGAEGGPTENGGEFPAFDSHPGRREVLFGVHCGRLPYSLHLTYYRYFGSALPSGFDSTLDWVNFSFEYRF